MAGELFGASFAKGDSDMVKRLLDDWEFDVLGICNYRKPGRLARYFDFIVENHTVIKGDICEAGVYRGHSLLATALLLKELNSPKLVWGFDNFEGFPAYHENDQLDKFDELFHLHRIDAETYRKVKLNQEYRQLILKTALTPANISSSADFSGSDLALLQAKIDYLELDNIRLVRGEFRETMTPEFDLTESFFACLMDCDIYDSYRVALPFVWSRLSHGGYLFLDEYYSLKFPGARIAIDEFFADKLDKPQMHRQIGGEFQRWFVRKIFEGRN